MSSAVTQVGKLPKNTVKLIQLLKCTPWLVFWWKIKRREVQTLAYLILTDRFTWCNVTLHRSGCRGIFPVSFLSSLRRLFPCRRLHFGCPKVVESAKAYVFQGLYFRPAGCYGYPPVVDLHSACLRRARFPMIPCGREADVQHILADCIAGRLVVLTSEPGMGATTLLEEGLRPELQAQKFIVVSWSDWQGKYFVSSLKDAIASAVRDQADPSFRAEIETLSEMLERVSKRTSRMVALLLDQFEDYVRCHFHTDISDAFDAELSNAIAGYYGRFVISLQDHGVKAFERFSQYIPNLLGFRVVLGPISQQAAREAFEREAARKGLEIEPSVVEALLQCPTVMLRDGVHPFFLMRGIRELLEATARLKSQVIRQGTLDGQGGPDRMILASLDGTIGELAKNQSELLFRWCNILISPEHHRLSLTEKALTDYAGKLNRFVPPTLAKLTASGILREVAMQDAPRFELAHDCLVPIVEDWWHRTEAALAARRRAQFRVRSISVAAGSILLSYLLWLFLSVRK